MTNFTFPILVKRDKRDGRNVVVRQIFDAFFTFFVREIFFQKFSEKFSKLKKTVLFRNIGNVESEKRASFANEPSGQDFVQASV